MRHKGLRRLECALLAALVISLGASAVPVARSCEQISDRVIRLHILANSDSAADQTEKLRVRDRVLREATEWADGAQNRAEAEAAIADALPEIERAAQAQLRADGCDTTVHAELTDMYFTARTYPAGTLPAGTYRALRLTIGAGRGHNWWCVVFPPVCVAAAADSPAMDDVLTPGQLDIVEHPGRYRVRLKVVEWWAQLRAWIAPHE